MKQRNVRWVTFALGVVVLAASVACGGASGSLSPTGPSGASAGGARITGHVNSTIGLQALAPNSFAPLATTSLHVSISGTNISSTVDGNGQFTLDGVPPGTVTLNFTGPNVSASITLTGVTAGETITVDVTLNGTSARINSERRDRDDDNETEGHITALDSNAKTITVGGKVISVPAAAKIHRGLTMLTFADLKVGMEVEVKTTLNGSTLEATDVEVEDGDLDNLSEVRGTVSGLGDTCPSISFSIGMRKVKTTAMTRFDDITCTQIKNDTRVEVKGMIGPDNVLMAARVELDD
ncbi:MAG TPA: DUF5666 domain-containing protein [Vicinamibacterales bacterium]|nr:DUF5666 domain-containing protein [Vicinamibacterales bacterium]